MIGWWLNHPSEKKYARHMDHLPRDRGKNKKYMFETTTQMKVFQLLLVIALAKLELHARKLICPLQKGPFQEEISSSKHHLARK